MQAKESDFYTAAGYRSKSRNPLTESMEDYLEMIFRLSAEEGFARVNELAARLNVTPSSSSKMVSVLRESGLVEFEKYSVIRLTAEGSRRGEWLLRRHQVLVRFFCELGDKSDALDLAEQVEHFLPEETIRQLNLLIEFMEQNSWQPESPTDSSAAPPAE